MKLSRYFVVLLVLVVLSTNIIASTKDKNQININFKDLEIEDLIKITSKIINKNILITSKITGKVDFISNEPIYKKDILNIVTYVLEEKGYTIIDNNGILRVVRLSEAARYNIPVHFNSNVKDEFQVTTEIFNVENINVDYVSAKIRHLISKNAKLVTDKESNTMILTDFYDNIKTIKKIVHLISMDTKKVIETVKLQYLSGTSVLADLQQVQKTVFNQKIEKEKVDILLNRDTNSIMFVGKKSNVDFLLNYLRDIDQPGSQIEKVVEVVYLKNIEANNILSVITGIAKEKEKETKATGIKTKSVASSGSQPFISVDEETNSMILMGAKEDIDYYKSVIAKLDVDRQQVYVQARVIEVSNSRAKEVGIKYGLVAGKADVDVGIGTLATKLGGDAVAVDPSLFGLSIPSGLDQGLALGATISLLNSNGAADIVSEPSLLCINNKESSIYVGETRSIKTGSTTTDGGNINDTYKREDIGLTLKVKPRISSGDKVLLELSTKVEDVDQTTTNDQPNTSKKELVTSAIVNNGESVILGGYIKETTDFSRTSIPLLGDIPILGNLFQNKNEVKDKVNLVIIITPYIVPKSKDLSYVREQLAQLKLLEDRYTKDAILRLEREKLESIKADKERQEDIEDVLADQKEEKEDQSNKEHQQRVKEIFGI
jgi:general secretion pathway protein D